MPNELTMSFSVSYKDANGREDDIGASGVQRTLAYPTMTRSPGLLVPVDGDIPVPLGGVITPVLLVVINLDPINYVIVLKSSGGAELAAIAGGNFALIPLVALDDHPALHADGANVRVDVMIA